MKSLKPIVLYIVAYVAAIVANWHNRAFSFALKQHNYPTLQDMVANLAIDTGAIEVVKWELYDYAIYPTAGVNNMPFFLTGIGAGQSSASGMAAGAAKTIADTNLTGAGVLPAPQAFWTEELEVVAEPGSVSTANTFVLNSMGTFLAVPTVAGLPTVGEADMNAILTTGAGQFSVSQKPYYQFAPLHRAPPSTRVQSDWAMCGNSATTGNTLKAKSYATGEGLRLDPGVTIMTAQNFNANLNWPAVVATLSGFNARIGFIMSGWLVRGVQ